MIGNWFCAPIIIKNLLKPGFNNKYTCTICFVCVWIVIGYFLFKKQTFNGLLKVIGIQIHFHEYIFLERYLYSYISPYILILNDNKLPVQFIWVQSCVTQNNVYFSIWFVSKKRINTYFKYVFILFFVTNQMIICTSEILKACV